MTTTTIPPTTTPDPNGPDPLPTPMRPCKNWYEDNTILAEVFYERLEVRNQKETPAYPVGFYLPIIFYLLF